MLVSLLGGFCGLTLLSAVRLGGLYCLYVAWGLLRFWFGWLMCFVVCLQYSTFSACLIVLTCFWLFAVVCLYLVQIGFDAYF